MGRGRERERGDEWVEAWPLLSAKTYFIPLFLASYLRQINLESTHHTHTHTHTIFKHTSTHTHTHLGTRKAYQNSFGKRAYARPDTFVSVSKYWVSNALPFIHCHSMSVRVCLPVCVCECVCEYECVCASVKCLYWTAVGAKLEQAYKNSIMTRQSWHNKSYTCRSFGFLRFGMELEPSYTYLWYAYALWAREI